MNFLGKPQSVFLSGTEEVKHITNSLYGKLKELNFNPIWYKRQFELENEDAIEECIKNVLKADRFIIIIGKKYGWIYPKNKCSITEEEFNIAYEYNKPILVLIQTAIYHQFKIYEKLKQQHKKILKSDLTTLGFEADPEIYEFILRIQNKRHQGIRKVPWISQFEDINDIERVVEDKWIKMRYDFTDKELKPKIVFLGLDSAGKSSILITLNDKFDYEEKINSILPTKGISRELFTFLGKTSSNWDFGGQERYRDINITFEKLYETKLVYFVIDIQDQERYVKALEFYKEVVKIIRMMVEPPPIIILFHKFDPTLTTQEKDEIDKRLDFLKFAINEISENLVVYFFKTSIFDMISLIDCYSSGLSLILDENEAIKVLFNDISRKHNVIMMALFNIMGVSLGEYYKPFLTISQKSKIYDYLVKVQRKIINEDKKVYKISDKLEYNQQFLGVIEVIKIGGLNFYLLFIVGELERQKDISMTLNTFKPQIEAIFEKITPNIF